MTVYQGHIKSASHSTFGAWDTFTYTVVYRPEWRGGDEVELAGVRPWNRPSATESANMDFWPHKPSALVQVHELGSEIRVVFPEPRPKYINCDGTQTW